MLTRRLGKTELEVTILGFGAIKLPAIPPEEASDCLNRALDLGINYIDTARNYRDSEEKIGKAVSHRRDEYYLATKTSARDAASVEVELATSLRNLRTEYIDVYQLHTVSDMSVWEQICAPSGAYEAALKAREQGKIRHIGITIHRDLQVMRKAIASNMFETLMVCYSPLDAESVAEDILPLAQKADMGVIIMKALSGGQLCQPLQERAPGLGGPDAIVAGALRYVLQNPDVTMTLAGMQAVREVEENFAVCDAFTPLAEDEQAELFRLIGNHQGDFRYGQRCLRCSYCQPCPTGIDIPTVFKAADMLQGYSENLQYLAHEVWDSIEVHPDACVECRQCIERCPAGLDIPKQLKQAALLFRT